MGRLVVCVSLVAIGVIAGCGDSEGAGTEAEAGADVSHDFTDESEEIGVDTDADATDDEPDAMPLLVEPGDLRFDLAAAREGADFFAFPYPSDLRLDDRGAPDLASFPTWRGVGTVLARAAEAVEGGSPGFSPLSAAYFVFERSLDPTTLPASPAAAAATQATAFIVDLTPGSPTYGERAVAEATYNDTGGGYWPPHTLALHPLYGLPLRPATTYAAVVTTGVRDADGQALQPPTVVAELSAILGGRAVEEGGVELAESLRPLHAALGDLGLEVGDLLVATVFTTSDPLDELVALRTWMRAELDPPSVASIALTQTETAYTLYEGTVNSVELFSGEAPYTRFGEGRIALDPQGAPLTAAPIALTFGVSVPVGEAPPAGWPVLLYAHGLGEDYLGFVRHIATPMAERGVAVIGVSPPLQGERNPTEMGDTELITSLAIANIVAGREILRQGVFDELRVAQLVELGLAIPAEVALGAADVAFDPTRVAFMGHSEGAQIGALLLALEPSLSAGVFSAGGGGAAITMLALVLDGLDVAAAVATIAGIEPAVETFDLHHPVTTVIIQPLLDAADPLHGARRVVREPGPNGPHDLVMTEAFEDHLTPPASTEALASALGLPIAEPLGRAIEGLELQGIGSVELPARDNVGVEGAGTVTAALLQLPEEGHYAIYFNEPVRAQLFDFVTSVLADEAELGPAASE